MFYFAELLAAVPVVPHTRAGWWAWVGLLIASHAGIVRFACDRLLGADYAWFLQCGLANQYLLGPGLQPSAFGVLLVSSLACYRRGWPLMAAALAAGVNAFHATYLLPAGLLVLGYLVAEWRAGRRGTALRLGALALALVAPVLAFHITRFGPTSAASFAEAQRILAEVRIPHHARPARWFDACAACQVVGMLAGLFAVRRSNLFVPLAVAGALALIGSVAVVATGNPTAALAFPWRLSALLVPFATAVLLARCAARLERWPALCKLLAGLTLALSVAGAVAVYALGLGYREPESEDAVLAYVRDTTTANDVYLVPARFPKPTVVRGVFSNTFAPPQPPTAVVYFELARFRLATGARLYVDFKAIPYRDDEVREWHARVANVEAWFAKPGDVSGWRAAGVTHVVAPASVPLPSGGLELRFEGGAYRVYSVRSPNP